MVRGEFVLDKMPWKSVSSAPGMLKRLPNAPSKVQVMTAEQIEKSIDKACQHSLAQAVDFAQHHSKVQ